MHQSSNNDPDPKIGLRSPYDYFIYEYKSTKIASQRR